MFQLLYRNVIAILACINFFYSAAQSPCTGTPSANSMLPSAHFTICAGTTANLSLANSYSNSGITFQWQSSSTSTVGPFTDINGARSQYYTTTVLHNTLYYNVVITCTNSGISINVPVTVSVVPCYTACTGTPSNTLAPASQTICAGNDATITTAGSTMYYTGYQYQWNSASAASGPYSSVPGATSNTYVSNNPGSTLYYNAVITCTNSGISFTTAPAAVHVTSCSACSGPPSTNTITGASTLCAGSSATLGIATAYSLTGLTYQWQTSSTSPAGPFSPQSGATLSSYTTQPLLANTFFNLVITCTNTSQNTSLLHSISVVSCATACAGPPPASSLLPVSQTICAGSAATLALSDTYSNSTGYNFQWQSAPAATGPFSAVAGGTATSYTTASLSTGAYYNVVITCTNSSQSFTTNTVFISVATCTACSGTPGSNTIVPVSPTICAGNSASLSLAATYTASGYTYQWQQSTTSLAGPFTAINNATTNAYTTPALANTVYYQLMVTCTNSGLSNTIVNPVYVIPCSTLCAGAPSNNTIIPQNHTVCAGAAASMSLVTNYTVAGITYQWLSANTAAGPFTVIPGANQSSYVQAAVSNTMYFKVVITCTATNQSFETVHEVKAINCETTGMSASAIPSGDGFEIFPNPVTQFVAVRAGNNQSGRLKITDLTGRLVLTAQFSGTASSVDVQELSPGIYFIQLEQNGRVFTKKLIKQ